jgi:hypothetical protein
VAGSHFANGLVDIQTSPLPASNAPTIVDIHPQGQQGIPASLPLVIHAYLLVLDCQGARPFAGSLGALFLFSNYIPSILLLLPIPIL